MDPAENIRSVERAMLVLRALNRRPIGTVRELCRETGLPATTLVRILGTLENLGYASKVGRRVGYTLTGKVAELSAGWHGYPAIHGRAGPVLAGLTGRLLWPAALATPDGDAMVVQLSTIPLSPLAHTHSTLGRRLALAASAHGRACLAFCPDEERQRLLRLLAAKGSGAPCAAALADRLGPMLGRARKRGYALRDSRTEPQYDFLADPPADRPFDPPADRRADLPADPGTTTVAVPVMDGGRVVSTIGITCFSGARTNPDLLARELKAAAAQIAQPESAPPESAPWDAGRGTLGGGRWAGG